ncbi:MAG: flagellar protein FlgN [Deltaproteobacteria bacterium]|nr:flagellar protein FlgN [Deltaproteobacteria bacterium]
MDNKLKSLYDSLLRVLRNEIEVYGELHKLFLNERALLVKSSMDELYENSSKKETCILKAKMLEEVRMNLVEKIFKLLNIDKKDINFSRLLSYGDDAQRRELTECQLSLRFLLNEINKLNKKNKMLLDSSLIYIQRSIDFINQLIYPTSNYLSTGKLKSNNMNGKIICWEG